MAAFKVAFVGSGSLGLDVASSLKQAGYGVDVQSLHAPEEEITISSSQEVLRDAELLVVAVANPNLSDCTGLSSDVISVLAEGAVVLICSTARPSQIVNLQDQLLVTRSDLLLADANLSRSLDGRLLVVVSGTDEAIAKSQDVLLAISRDYTVVKGGLSSSSKFNLVNRLLVGVHLAVAAEAIALGACAGLNTQILYDIISNAAGSSKVFANIAPLMINSTDRSVADLDLIAEHLGAVLDEAKELRFPLPLTAVAHQQILRGCASGYGNERCSAVVKIWGEATGFGSVVHETGQPLDTVEGMMKKVENVALKVDRLAFVGLGAMGFGMATNLLRKGFTVQGYDVYEPSVERFAKAGGKASLSPAECVKGVEVLIVMVTNESQVENVLFGHQGAVQGFSRGSTVVLCSTVSPDFTRKLERRLSAEGKDLCLVDAPVSGGVKKAADGTLTIMSAGSTEAIKRAGAVLLAMSENLYTLEGGPGLGSSVKMVNQLLAGVHIAVSAEAIALGARLGLEGHSLYNFIENADGSSWMFINRVPHMLNGDYTPLSALDIFVKDMGIVCSEGKRLCIPLPVASSALQQYLMGSAAGWGREDDSAVVKIFEKMTGVKVESNPFSTTPTKSSELVLPESTDLPSLPKDITLSSLPSEWPEDPLDETHHIKGESPAKVVVVLDDDPTGTQTVYGITVLTDWAISVLMEEFQKRPACFYILTNSRALSGEQAALLIKDICQNVATAAAATGGIGYTIVLRGDSTLRGHFPEEARAAASVIGDSDAWIICPFFLQGGRYTINDIHYVADANTLIPAGNTEFAQDAVFGYRSSNMREWVEEKMQGGVAAENVSSISIETIRKGGPQAVCDELCALRKGAICVVNSASERDIQVFTAGMIRAEAIGKQFLCRTAAAFVSALIGLRPKPLCTPRDLGPLGDSGGLIVVGSYVPKTTTQVAEARLSCGKQIEWITVNVAAISLESSSARDFEIAQAAGFANLALAMGRDTLIMTSRDILTGASKDENIKIGTSISSALVEIVNRITVRPRYLLAKGGITSSDIATKAMRVQKAEVLGQVLPGVPIWKFGQSSRYPDLPYIVFPGNVGGTDALAKVIQSWSKPNRSSTKDVLQAAKDGGYAIGAFNVYNLEGILAVVAAAEAEQSPAILQIHPASLSNGGEPLVAACAAAAKISTVPITVHLDHGTEERELLKAIELGFDSIMVDGSKLSFRENIASTKSIAKEAHAKDIFVEAELGRLSGTEDGLTVEEYEALLTDVVEAQEFLEETEVDALAVCIGNVHGKYPESGPRLNFDLLQRLNAVAGRRSTVLVLHGASGLSAKDVKACIELGVAKFNVNTELRGAYMDTLKTQHRDLVDFSHSSMEAMRKVVAEKLRLFGSSGKANKGW